MPKLPEWASLGHISKICSLLSIEIDPRGGRRFSPIRKGIENIYVNELHLDNSQVPVNYLLPRRVRVVLKKKKKKLLRSTGVQKVYFRNHLLQTKICNEKSTGLQTILGRRGITIRKSSQISMAILSVARIQGKGNTFLWALRGKLTLYTKSLLEFREKMLSGLVLCDTERQSHRMVIVINFLVFVKSSVAGLEVNVFRSPAGNTMKF